MLKYIAAIASILIPGLGQVFHGQLWAGLGWFIFGMIFPPFGNIGSAIHAFLEGR